MRSVFLSAVMTAVLTVAASAATIVGAIGGAGSTILAPVSVGDTVLTFVSNPTGMTLISGGNMAAAGGTGTFDANPLSIMSGGPLTLSFAGGLSFVADPLPNPLVAGNGSGGFAMNLTGVYNSSVAGYNSSYGEMNLTFQPPSIPTGNNNVYTFSMSGEAYGRDVPEPATLALIGGSLIGLSVLRRRH